ncbi:MAG: CDP-alcohol phosphatidyltransferase family protein [Lysobacteraceae bacterium]|nr:MAG: CDP-alcohol phosphatidyltransferase family protein [Xanthomonadaceae bacterium]
MLRHLPNLITLLRMALVVPLCWMISDGRHDRALLVAAIAGFSDALDGYIAKRCGWQSWIGGMLDPVADKLLLTAAFVSLALVGGIEGWLAALVVGRDFVIVAGAVAYHNLVGRFDAAPSRVSKLTTVVQIAYVLLELLRLSDWIELPRILHLAAIAAVAALTAASGLHYLFAWGRRARDVVRSRKETMR